MVLVNYPSLAEADTAKLRTSPNPLLGWEPKATIDNGDGTFTIDWADDADPRNSLNIVITKVTQSLRDTLEKKLASQFVDIEDLDDIVGEPAFAEIAAVDHITSAPQQTGINSTPVKINQFNKIVRSKNITISGPDNNLTILLPGFYKIEFHFSMTGSTNTNFQVVPFVNGLQNGFNSFDDDDIRHIDTVRKTGTAPGDVGAMSASGIAHLDAGDVVDLRVTTDDVAGANFNVIRANFIIARVR